MAIIIIRTVLRIIIIFFFFFNGLDRNTSPTTVSHHNINLSLMQESRPLTCASAVVASLLQSSHRRDGYVKSHRSVRLIASMSAGQRSYYDLVAPAEQQRHSLRYLHDMIACFWWIARQQERGIGTSMRVLLGSADDVRYLREATEVYRDPLHQWSGSAGSESLSRGCVTIHVDVAGSAFLELASTQSETSVRGGFRVASLTCSDMRDDLLSRQSPSSMPWLTALTLSGSGLFLGTALRDLHTPCLQELRLNDCSSLCDDALSCLNQFPELRLVDVSNCSMISGLGLKDVRLRKLETLVLRSCKLTDRGIEALSHCCSALTALDVSSNMINGFGFQPLRLPHLKYLSMGNCLTLLDSGLSCLQHCTLDALQSLDLTRCVSITGAAFESLRLPRLTTVRLVGCRDLRDEHLCHLTKCCPSLVELDLSDCKQVAAVGLRDGGLLLPPLLHAKFECCMMLEDASLRDLSACFPSLASLDLSNCVGLSTEAFSAEPVDIEGGGGQLVDSDRMNAVALFPNLESITLEFCFCLCDNLLDALQRCCPRLQRLRLSDCNDVSANLLLSLKHMRPQGKTAPAVFPSSLRTLSLEICSSLSKDAVQCLAACDHVETLELASCSDVPPDSFANVDLLRLRRLTLKSVQHDALAASFPSTTLRVLEDVHLNGCEFFAGDIFWNCPALKTLHLERCDHVASGGVLFRSLPTGRVQHPPMLATLRELRLEWCGDLRDEALITDDTAVSHPALTIRLPLVEHLSFSHCDALEGSILAAMEAPLLESLNLSYCRCLRDEAFSSVQRFPQLRSLDLSGCALASSLSGFGEVSDASRRLAHDSGCGLPLLESLHLEKAKNLNDDGVRRFLVSCPKLAKVNLHGCDLVTGSAFERAHGGQHICYFFNIKDVSVAECIGLTTAGFVALVSACPLLERLDARKTPSAPETKIYRIADLCAVRQEAADQKRRMR